MSLQKKDESGLALCQEHPYTSLCPIGPGNNHGNPPVVVLLFLLPVAEVGFGSKENVRNSEVESVESYSLYSL